MASSPRSSWSTAGSGFVASSIRSTVILFDDYRDRPWYHVVADFLPVKDRCGRQALFEVPASINRSEIKVARDHFLYVRE